MSEKYIVYTENPEEELWNALSQYTYKARILKYFSEHQININDDVKDSVCEIISSSLSQAKEYFTLSNSASLHVSPLLLYYGTINLFLGAAVLKTGSKCRIENHGMKTNVDYVDNSIGSTKIHFFNNNTGGIHVFMKKLNLDQNLTESEDWTIKELLLSIPDINQEALQCYDYTENYCYPIEQSISENGKIDRVIFHNKSLDQIDAIFKSIPNFSKSYLPPVTNQQGGCFVSLLRHKYLANNNNIRAHYDQEFLECGHAKNGKLIVLPQWVYMYIALFGLGSLCRYEPEKWNPFLRQDESGEKLLIDKFLNAVKRIIPNIVISLITNKEYRFENRKYQPENNIKILGEHEIKEFIQSEVFKMERDKK